MYVPGVGDLTKEEYLAHKAASEYDDRLSFKRNPFDGQYAIFVKLDRHDVSKLPEKPVLGFGYKVPSPDEVKMKILEADTWKHGQKILDDMDARKAAHDKANEDIRVAARDESAERIEKHLRKQGLSPTIKSLRKIT
jgi:hypothetical protein